MGEEKTRCKRRRSKEKIEGRGRKKTQVWQIQQKHEFYKSISILGWSCVKSPSKRRMKEGRLRTEEDVRERIWQVSGKLFTYKITETMTNWIFRSVLNM